MSTRIYGYYLFLGRGDYELAYPREATGHLTAAWTTTWTAATWKGRIDFLMDRLGANTLAILMNGFGLPYPSERFAEVCERDHPNVQQEFFQEVLDYARGRGLRMIASLCTTGHAGGYAQAHPECATLAAAGTRHAYLAGNGRHSFNLCHNHPLGQAYAEGVIAEVLSRYHGFAGVLFHPPEHFVPCRCAYCDQAFRAASGQGLAEVSAGEVACAYWASYMAFQRTLAEGAGALVPNLRVFSFNIPGVFDEYFAVIAPEIPRTTTIVHWDYSSYSPERYPALVAALRLYGSAGHPVAFTPTSSYALPTDNPQYGELVARQIDVVRGAGVAEILYYHGPIWMEETILATAWKRQAMESTKEIK